METYLPIIKTTLSDWALLTLNNPYYAVALAAVVFLLTAILYSIRVASLNKEIVAGENKSIEIQNNLNSVQQKMQLIQEELAANNELMQKESQAARKEADRAAKLEELLSQRNKQIAGIIQSLHTSFDLGERPVPVMGDTKAEGLWQQHDRVINLLITRLQSEQQAKTQLQQSYQAETVKRAEKEALLETLQTTLSAQASQVSKLEQALEEQKSILQQQQDQAQRVLSQTLEKHLAELARLTELEQQALELVNTRQQLTHLEEKLNIKDTLINQLEKDQSIGQVKAQPALLKQEEIATLIETPKTDEEVASATPPDIEQQPVSPGKEQTGGVAGKLKNLFGKAKQEPMPAETKVAEIKMEEAVNQPAASDVEQLPVSAAKGQIGKLKNLFGSKPQSEDTNHEEAQPEPSAEEQHPVATAKGQFGKLKNLFGSKTQPEEKNREEAQPALPAEEQAPVSAAKDRFGRKKYYFGDIRHQAEDTKQEEPEIQTAPSVEERAPVSAAKGRFGKLKNLFGKTK
ncbi:MAG: hypothetical protein PHY54_04470 [Methylococcales bacterium]|nr:hypothetical protein [Methylococcales bacterium]